MDNIRTLHGDVIARDLRITILAARFNDAIVENLIRGAVDALLRHGASEKQIEIIRVPGAYDLPFIARRVAAAKRCDAIVALGAVIRGATPHFDYVCSQCASAWHGPRTTPACRSRSACSRPTRSSRLSSVPAPRQATRARMRRSWRWNSPT